MFTSLTQVWESVPFAQTPHPLEDTFQVKELQFQQEQGEEPDPVSLPIPEP